MSHFIERSSVYQDLTAGNWDPDFTKVPWEDSYRVKNMKSSSGHRDVKNLRRIVLLAFFAATFREKNLECAESWDAGSVETQKSCFEYVRILEYVLNKYLNLEAETLATQSAAAVPYDEQNFSSHPSKAHIKALCRWTKILAKYLRACKSLMLALVKSSVGFPKYSTEGEVHSNCWLQPF